MPLRYCPHHGRAWQPATAGGRGQQGVSYPPTPAHWRPLPLGVLCLAADAARWGGCALPMEVTACDVCAEEGPEGLAKKEQS